MNEISFNDAMAEAIWHGSQWTSQFERPLRELFGARVDTLIALAKRSDERREAEQEVLERMSEEDRVLHRDREHRRIHRTFVSGCLECESNRSWITSWLGQKLE